ncbi:MAG TPA: hypothetical protein VFV72_14000 [Candidatus Limnocylindrales bacterium]|nr:hypothetical protein [Candidatus Limnocylindrales bacterium]
MTTVVLARRVMIVIACLLAIAGVVAIVRIAAAVRADAAPLVAPPVSVETIAAEIDAESARAAGLTSALLILQSRTSDLDAALAAADDQMTSDTNLAEQLRADLAAAKARLATLQAELAAAQARLARLVAAADAAGVAAAAPPPPADTTAAEDHDDHDEHEEDDDD